MKKWKRFFYVLFVMLCICPFLNQGKALAESTDNEVSEAKVLPVHYIFSYGDMSRKEAAGDIKPYIEHMTENKAYYYKISQEEGDAVLRFKLAAENIGYTWELYTDEKLNNCIKSGMVNKNETSDKIIANYKKGACYYLKIIPYYFYPVLDFTFSAEVGYIPIEQFLNFGYSETKPTNKNVVVSLYIFEDCKKLYLSGSPAFSEKDKITKTEQKIEKNGTYYVTIVDSLGLISQRAFIINNIDKKAPVKPKITAYKRNTCFIKGTGEKNTTVFARIGKKTYKAYVSKTGKFIIKTPVLKKKMKITVYVKDDAGNKGAAAAVTVK